MDFKKLITAPAGAVASLLGVGQDGPTTEQAAMAKLLANGSVDQFAPPAPTGEFQLPGLDESLSPAGQKRKDAAEAAGQPFTPGESDYTDSGPFGYLHKKGLHDALMAYHQELQANAPHIDYQGILKQKLSDLASMPAEHHTNPLTLFAMAMGDPEHARELIQTHNKGESEANAKQTQRWQELLDLKQQALEGSVKQALAEGDSRKIISGKWLDALAQIEQDKAKLTGELTKGQQKDAAAERRAQVRGEWAVKAVTQRTGAMLQASGLKADSAEFRSLQANAKTLAQGLIKNGADPVDAYDQAEEWVTGQISSRGTAGAGVGGGGHSSTPASAAGAAGNPLQARIEANRKSKATTPAPTK
jgi:hypothetical protein